MMKINFQRLGDVAKIGAGQSAPVEGDFNSHEGVPFIRAGHLQSLILGEDLANLPHVDSASAKKNRLRLLPEKSIVFAKSGMSAMMNRVYYLQHDSYYVSHLASVVTDSSILDSKYCYYFLMYFKTSNLIKDSSYPSIGLPDIEKIQIPIPTLSIQKQIANILDKADALRKKDQQLLQKYDELVQAIFIDMFGDPVKNEKGWELKTIGTSYDFLTSGSRGWAKYYAKKGDLFLRINNLGYNEIRLQDLVYVDTPSNAEAKRTRVKGGDILLSITADLGRSCVVPVDLPDAYINQHLAIIRLKENFDPYFVSQVLASDLGRSQFKTLNKGGVKAGLNFDDIKSLKFINPPLEIQRQFSMLAKQISLQRSVHENSLKNSIDLFSSILEKAFNGELIN